MPQLYKDIDIPLIIQNSWIINMREVCYSVFYNHQDVIMGEASGGKSKDTPFRVTLKKTPPSEKLQRVVLELVF